MSVELPGVYYARADCAGLVRRLVVDAVDGAVLLALWVAIVMAAFLMRLPGDLAEGLCKLAIPLSWALYLVVLKHFWKTAGYWVCGVSVVNLQGQRPSFRATCLRAFFFFLAPFEYFLDLLLLTMDPHRQAIRDKYSRTYVIRRGAAPAGRGCIRYVLLDTLNFALILPEVSRADAVGETGNFSSARLLQVAPPFSNS